MATVIYTFLKKKEGLIMTEISQTDRGGMLKKDFCFAQRLVCRKTEKARHKSPLAISDLKAQHPPALSVLCSEKPRSPHPPSAILDIISSRAELTYPGGAFSVCVVAL
jgi:hypothetical protein